MGVSTHSEPKKCFIFSVYKSHRSQGENENNHAVMAEFFTSHGIHYVPVIGRYQGQLEEGFLVSANAVPEEAVLYYSRHYHQDEYMVLDNHKHGTYIASMVNCATREQRQVGFMRSMPEADVIAMNLDYTYRPDLKEYWVVWHTDTTVMTKFAEEVKERVGRLVDAIGTKHTPLPPEQEPFGTPAYC